MNDEQSYFFCGVGGSGMLPLAMILRGRGARVAGSDRSYDQGRTPDKFAYLRDLGIALHPQDGSGLKSDAQTLVASAAVEETVPDVVAAKAVGAARMTRAQLLAQLFNEAVCPIGVAGTSGKSTTTAMTGWILSDAGKDPTIMNGAVMKNFVRDDALFASALVGEGAAFVSEVDESDGSIAMFAPQIAVLNNVALDHKTMDELRALFGDFVGKARLAVLNLDNDETAALAAQFCDKAVTYSLDDQGADYFSSDVSLRFDGVDFIAHDRRGGERAKIRLAMPGRHNVANGLAAIAAAGAAGVPFQAAAKALGDFAGVKRRFDIVGAAGDITIVDDFGHNPDKIAATLKAAHAFEGRLLVMFQPHGFGPLKKMRREFIDCFVGNLNPADHLIMPPPVYHGGTVDRDVSSEDIAAGVKEGGRQATALQSREACGARLLELAAPGDRIIIMGARDDTLSVFAGDILKQLAAR